MALSEAIKQVLAQNVTAFVTLWRVQARDGLTIRVCNHTDNLNFGGEWYFAMPLGPTEWQSNANLTPDNGEVTAVLTSDGFTERDLLGGRWAHARVNMYVVDVDNLSAGYAKHVKGRFGEIELKSQTFTTEVRGLTAILNQEIGDLASETCRVRVLGAFPCNKDLTAFTHDATVTAVSADRRTFTVSIAQPDAYFAYGRITWLDGENGGLDGEIERNVAAAASSGGDIDIEIGDGGEPDLDSPPGESGTVITLAQAMLNEIQVGDTVRLVAGCDRTRATCRDKFANVINFEGEPDVPGLERVLTFPE